MDNCVKEPKIIPTQGTSKKLRNSSVILSVFAILLTIALFVRIETVVRETRMTESKFSQEIQHIKDALKEVVKHQAIVKEDLDATKGFHSRRTIVRRSLKTNQNKSKDWEEVGDAMKRYVASIMVESFCRAPGRVCVPGPPGPKGIQGLRGKRGPKGTKGKKGTKGIMGPPGSPGKQGMMGDIGASGVPGEKGNPGLPGYPGHPGPKGEPGESIFAPEISVSPPSLTVTENQTAMFYCSADGNPKPEVSWSKISGAGSVKPDVQQNNLEITNATYSDSGKYVCKATSILGNVQRVVELFVEVPPQLAEVPAKVITVAEDTTATIVCRAFGFPPPVIHWSKAFSSLPQGRSVVVNDTLTISRFRLHDSGSYQCKATNKLGSVSSTSTLNFQPAVCSRGWVSYNRLCYHIIDTPTLKWSDARRTCTNLGGDLAVIKSADENRFIFDLVKKQNTVTEWGVWIGFKRNDANSFYWIDGTPLDGGYSTWASGEPNNNHEKCGNLYGKGSSAGKWNDISCNVPSHYRHLCPVILCQKQMN